MIQIYALAGAVAASLALGGLAGYRLRDVTADRDIAALRAQHAQAVAVAASAAQTAERAARTEEQRRVIAAQEIADAAQARLDRVQADADRARRTAAGLRSAAAAAAARCNPTPGNPATPAASAAAAGPGLVLADVLSRADDRAGGLAEAFDRAYAAGLACERIHDALRAVGR